MHKPKVVYMMLRLSLNHLHSAQFLCQLSVQNSFLNSEPFTMREFYGGPCNFKSSWKYNVAFNSQSCEDGRSSCCISHRAASNFDVACEWINNEPTIDFCWKCSSGYSKSVGPGFAHVSPIRPPAQAVPTLQTSSPSSGSQEMTTNNESVPDLKPVVSGVTHQLRPVGSLLNTISQARVMNSAALSGGTSIGLQNISQNNMAMHVSNMISSGMASLVAAAQNVFSSSGPHTLTQVPQSTGINSFASAPSNLSGNTTIGMSQPMRNLQGGASIGQSIPGMSQGNLSGPQMVQSGIGMNSSMMNGLGSSGSSGTGTVIPTPGMSQQAQSGIQSLGANNSSASNVPLSQQNTSALHSAQSKYVKVWEASLAYSICREGRCK